MNVLGIESSCDETGVAIVTMKPGDARPTLLAQALHSQMAMHNAYGGVVPELASRDHIQRLVPLVREVMSSAELALADIDVIAYTRGPGLAGALLVGAGMACALAVALDKPSIGIHHLEGHLLSAYLSNQVPAFPFVALLVSGGHTQLMTAHAVGHYVLLGETVDDAAGEAFDKSAKLLGLGYPGGPALARLAVLGNAKAFNLPRPLLHDGTLDFSFAGLKTSVMTHWRKVESAARGDGPSPALERARADMAASTEAAIVDVLVAKSLKALKRTGLKQLVVAGGVGANARLRERLDTQCAGVGASVIYPPLNLCSDNGAMIAAAGAMRVLLGVEVPTKNSAFDVRPRWPLAEGENPNALLPDPPSSSKAIRAGRA